MAKKIKTKFAKIVLIYLLLELFFANLAFASQPPPTIVGMELLEPPTRIVVCEAVDPNCPAGISDTPTIFFYKGEKKQLAAYAYYESRGPSTGAPRAP